MDGDNFRWSLGGRALHFFGYSSYYVNFKRLSIYIFFVHSNRYDIKYVQVFVGKWDESNFNNDVGTCHNKKFY